MKSPEVLKSIAPKVTLVAAIMIAPMGSGLAGEIQVKIESNLADAAALPSRIHAQNLASVCASAQAAGLDFVALGFNNLNITIKKIVQGGKPTEGAFTSTVFKGEKLSHKQQLAAAKHLRIVRGVLRYAPAKGHPISATDQKANPQEIVNAAKEARNRRNAQNLVSVCSAAQAAGFDFVAKGKQNAQHTVALVVQGGTIEEGPFKGTLFVVPNMSLADQAEALRYIRLERGRLTYVARP